MSAFQLVGDTILFDGQPVGTLTVPEGTLRGEVEAVLVPADGRGSAYALGRAAGERLGYARGRADGWIAGYDDAKKERA